MAILDDGVLPFGGVPELLRSLAEAYGSERLLCGSVAPYALLGPIMRPLVGAYPSEVRASYGMVCQQAAEVLAASGLSPAQVDDVLCGTAHRRFSFGTSAPRRQFEDGADSSKETAKKRKTT